MPCGTSYGCVGGADGHIVQAINGCRVSPRNEAAIDIHGDLNAVMSPLLLNVHRRFSLLNQERGVGMPQIVDVHLAETCFR